MKFMRLEKNNPYNGLWDEQDRCLIGKKVNYIIKGVKDGLRESRGLKTFKGCNLMVEDFKGKENSV